MTTAESTVFLIDVDNTLLDNDHIQSDLRAQLQHTVGAAECDRYWEIIETLREELGYVDYLGSLQRLRKAGVNDLQLLQLSTFLIDYSFSKRVYEGVHEALRHLRQWGPTVILSDGDVVFQPRKVERSGLFDTVSGRVLIYIHKENELDDVERRFPADHYVLIDDKIRILTAVKKIWGARLTTVFPRQGHYALAPEVAGYPAPDLALERIGDLCDYDLAQLLALGRNR